MFAKLKVDASQANAGEIVMITNVFSNFKVEIRCMNGNTCLVKDDELLYISTEDVLIRLNM